jgi:fumarylacetoacetate (FAA) hydrolase family protein
MVTPGARSVPWEGVLTPVPQTALPLTGAEGSAVWVGRVWDSGPCVVTVRGDLVVDVTSRAAPTVRDLLELDDPAAHLRASPGRQLGTLAEIAAAGPRLLAPCDRRR